MTRKIRLRIDELLVKHDLSLRKFAEAVDINHSLLIQHRMGRKKQISYHHIEQILDTFEIDDISEVIEIVHDLDEE